MGSLHKLGNAVLLLQRHQTRVQQGEIQRRHDKHVRRSGDCSGNNERFFSSVKQLPSAFDASNASSVLNFWGMAEAASSNVKSFHWRVWH
jgi:hypothetical protein